MKDEQDGQISRKRQIRHTQERREERRDERDWEDESANDHTHWEGDRGRHQLLIHTLVHTHHPPEGSVPG